MEVKEILLNGNSQAWIRWKGVVEVLLQHIPPSRDKEMQRRFLRPQWKGHQRMADEIDLDAMRDYYCTEVVKGIRGLQKEGQPFEPDAAFIKTLWDGNRDFQTFVVQAAFEIDNFVAEKNA